MQPSSKRLVACLCKNEPDKSFLIGIPCTEESKRPYNWLVDLIELLLLQKFSVEMIKPELLFTGFVDNQTEISNCRDCFPIYYNIKAGYEELFPVKIE